MWSGPDRNRSGKEERCLNYVALPIDRPGNVVHPAWPAHSRGLEVQDILSQVWYRRGHTARHKDTASCRWCSLCLQRIFVRIACQLLSHQTHFWLDSFARVEHFVTPSLICRRAAYRSGTSSGSGSGMMSGGSSGLCCVCGGRHWRLLHRLKAGVLGWGKAQVLFLSLWTRWICFRYSSVMAWVTSLDQSSGDTATHTWVRLSIVG